MCDSQTQVQRKPRTDTDPRIHYDTIASSNQMMKNGMTRNRIDKKLNALCFEMKAAGLMSDFSCLMIRDICDYSYSHKNSKWQKYATDVTIDFAKKLLGKISTNEIRQAKTIVQMFDEGYF